MRPLALVAALCLGLSPLHASALTALFDFDDFPPGVGPSDPLFNAPYTYLYGCDGKDYCTGQEAEGANTDGDPLPRTISTTRNGITMEFGRYGGGYSVNFDGAGALDTGDPALPDFTLFLFDFDTPLHSFAGRISPPERVGEDCVDDGHGGDICTDFYSLIKLYLWSDPGGQGSLVGGLTIAYGEPFDGTVSLATGLPFRSATFGHAEPPNDGDHETWDNQYGIADILVSTVPEPSTAALVGLGVVAVAAGRRRRLATLLGAGLILALAPHPASAVSALFDFDDFPPGVGFNDPLWNAPYTYLYGCGGKDYCTGREILGANTDGDYRPNTISTTRNGTTMELGRHGGTYSVDYDGHGMVDTGDDPEDFMLFLLDFDTPLHSFAGRISGPQVIDQVCDDDGYGGEVCTDVYTLVKLYLWSDPGGQGTLVGSLTIDLGNPFAGTVSLVTDRSFRSADFGRALSLDPDCIAGSPGHTCGYEINNLGRWGNNYIIDNILVSTVPEPGPAMLLMLGLTSLAAARRTRPIV